MRNCLALTAVAVVLLVSTAVAGAAEIQLSGMRLGQHAINLLDVWDQPDGIVVGEGPESAPSAPQMGGAAAGMPMYTQPGMGMDMGMGMPMGGTLEYTDDVTLQKAMESRKAL